MAAWGLIPHNIASVICAPSAHTLLNDGHRSVEDKARDADDPSVKSDGVVNGLISNLFVVRVNQVMKSGELVDIMHYHISARGRYHGRWFRAEQQYRDIMRDPDNVNFVTLIREPRSHLIRCVSAAIAGVYSARGKGACSCQRRARIMFFYKATYHATDRSLHSVCS